MLCLGCKYNNKPQAICNHLQEECGNIITKTTMHGVENSPIQGPVLYKPRSDFFIADWLERHNHAGDRDEEIPGMKLCIDAVHTSIDILA